MSRPAGRPPNPKKQRSRQRMGLGGLGVSPISLGQLPAPLSGAVPRSPPPPPPNARCKAEKNKIGKKKSNNFPASRGKFPAGGARGDLPGAAGRCARRRAPAPAAAAPGNENRDRREPPRGLPGAPGTCAGGERGAGPARSAALPSAGPGALAVRWRFAGVRLPVRSGALPGCNILWK